MMDDILKDDIENDYEEMRSNFDNNFKNLTILMYIETHELTKIKLEEFSYDLR